jgi:hypothetical protein
MFAIRSACLYLDELTGWQNKYDTVVGKKLVKEMVVRDVNHPCYYFLGQRKRRWVEYGTGRSV